jgi:hypothetical protein
MMIIGPGITVKGGVNFSPEIKAATLPIATSGLQLYVDSTNTSSYSGTGSTWTDLSGNGNNGTLVNTPNWTTIDGARTFGFDGVTNRVSFSYQTPIQSNSTAFTWSCWVRANRNYDGDVLMGNRGGAELKFTKLTTQKFEFYPAEVFIQVPLTVWKNLTAVWDGSGSSAGTNMRLYHNGVQVGLRDADNPSFNATPITFNIGGDNVAGEYFQGYLSSAMVYNRALSDAEILSNFNALRATYGV